MDAKNSLNPSFHQVSLPASWELLQTDDGSPSLKWKAGESEEAMHHQGGAFSETQYIYEPLLKAGFSQFKSPRILSLGLGLGYNEIFAARTALSFPESKPQIYSFEIDPWLRSEFSTWIQGDDSSVLAPAYAYICKTFDDAGGGIRAKLLELYQTGCLHLYGALKTAEQVPEGTQVFLWDAFSRKTSPELWDEEFLKACFARSTADAGLATYARQGNLKRALRDSSFTIEDRAGFKGKRNSTWASKGSFKLPLL